LPFEFWLQEETEEAAEAGEVAEAEEAASTASSSSSASASPLVWCCWVNWSPIPLRQWGVEVDYSTAVLPSVSRKALQMSTFLDSGMIDKLRSHPACGLEWIKLLIVASECRVNDGGPNNFCLLRSEEQQHRLRAPAFLETAQELDLHLRTDLELLSFLRGRKGRSRSGGCESRTGVPHLHPPPPLVVQFCIDKRRSKPCPWDRKKGGGEDTKKPDGEESDCLERLFLRPPREKVFAKLRRHFTKFARVILDKWREEMQRDGDNRRQGQSRVNESIALFFRIFEGDYMPSS
jgi:hypothetical protein